CEIISPRRISQSHGLAASEDQGEVAFTGVQLTLVQEVGAVEVAYRVAQTLTQNPDLCLGHGLSIGLTRRLDQGGQESRFAPLALAAHRNQRATRQPHQGGAHHTYPPESALRFHLLYRFHRGSPNSGKPFRSAELLSCIGTPRAQN